MKVERDRGVLLILAGFLLIATGTLHFFYWFIAGTAWEGETSLRKPILFGISGGLTLVSMGQLLRISRTSRNDHWIARVMSSAMILEVGLISVQQWRGVPSHFNHSTAFNTFVDYAITGLILVVVTCILLVAWRSFRFPMMVPPDAKFAWRAGLGYLLVSCLIGFGIFVYGTLKARAGEDPTIYGRAGVLKFPHGMTIHAIQSLPGLSWLLAKLKIDEGSRLASVRLAVAATGCTLLYSIVQTAAGRERSDLSFLSASLLVTAFLLIIPICFALGRRLLNLRWKP